MHVIVLREQSGMPDDKEKIIHYCYTFVLGDDRRETFELHLDRLTLALQPQVREDPPDWTRLSYFMCPNCPLDAGLASHCPIAVNILDLVRFFKNVASYDRLQVEIATDERTYYKDTATSEAVSSLLGIFMVTSGCPVMDKLRPLVRFHLPLATTEETTFRAVAMYLVAQYFLMKQGKKPDWTLKGLHAIYEDVQTVNRSFTQRLKGATHNDASTNAVVRLDAFASAVVMSIDLDRLDGLETLFEAYFT